MLGQRGGRGHRDPILQVYFQWRAAQPVHPSLDDVGSRWHLDILGLPPFKSSNQSSIDKKLHSRKQGANVQRSDHPDYGHLPSPFIAHTDLNHFGDAASHVTDGNRRDGDREGSAAPDQSRRTADESDPDRSSIANFKTPTELAAAPLRNEPRGVRSATRLACLKHSEKLSATDSPFGHHRICPQPLDGWPNWHLPSPLLHLGSAAKVRRRTAQRRSMCPGSTRASWSQGCTCSKAEQDRPAKPHSRQIWYAVDSCPYLTHLKSGRTHRQRRLRRLLNEVSTLRTTTTNSATATITPISWSGLSAIVSGLTTSATTTKTSTTPTAIPDSARVGLPAHDCIRCLIECSFVGVAATALSRSVADASATLASPSAACSSGLGYSRPTATAALIAREPAARSVVISTSWPMSAARAWTCSRTRRGLAFLQRAR